MNAESFAACAPAGNDGAWHVYIVRCADGSLYTGIARDPLRRIERHNAGKGARYTRSRRPVHLVFLQPVASRSAALRLEARLKRLRRSAKLALLGASPRN